MIRRMQQIPGGWARPDSRALVQNSYLHLVETLEGALSSWFEDDDGAVAGLHGEHYKLIRDMTASIPRPSRAQPGVSGASWSRNASCARSSASRAVRGQCPSNPWLPVTNQAAG